LSKNHEARIKDYGVRTSKILIQFAVSTNKTTLTTDKLSLSNEETSNAINSEIEKSATVGDAGA